MKISVITPSFNQAQFFPINLASLRSQQNVDVEHIVVDPGSTDGSTEIARKASHVLLIAEPDRGQSDGICKGFRTATGDILAWLNSDDFYPDDGVLASVLQCFRDNPDVDIVYGDVNFVDESGAFLRKGIVNKNVNQLLNSFHYQVGIIQPGVFWRRHIYEEIGGPSEEFEYCMDYELWVRMATKGYKWKYLPKVLANHRWWGGMKTSSRRDLSLREHFKVCNHYFSYVHWKWLDRYADYLCSGLDGVINHATTIDVGAKDLAVRRVIDEVVTQEMLRKMWSTTDQEIVATRQYIYDRCPGKTRIYFSQSEINIISENADDPIAQQRVAWNIFTVSTAWGNQLVAYHVPGNFDYYYDDDWYVRQLMRTKETLSRLQKERSGDVCVIVGNGPSLLKSDLSLLENIDTIISNFAAMNPDLSRFAKILTVVNDLVAKQGAIDFNASNLMKFVPFWLANSFNDGDNTFFVNATVRPEFSFDFVESASWRSTVSFFNMQLAYALGYKKVILIGFDHSYVQPKGLLEGEVIHQTEDDENHFDPRYFKGKDWQAADTSNMEKMYLLAKTAYQKDGREIVNCTIGGKLAVFRRGDLYAELNQENGNNGVGKQSEGKSLFFVKNDLSCLASSEQKYPKLLIIDITKIGDGTATGEIKKNLLGGWPKEKLLQIYGMGYVKIGLYRPSSSESQLTGPQEIRENVKRYNPDVILYRPVPNNLPLHNLAMELISQSNAPLVTWTMDDWPARLKREDYKKYVKLEQDYRGLLGRSLLNLSICQKMSYAFRERYGVTFIPLANGVSLEQWPRKEICKQKPKTVLVRYAGSLAENMTLQSIVRVARAIEKIGESYEIKFEILTKKIWWDKAIKYFSELKRSTFLIDQLSADDYRGWLSEADMLVIAYNYDPISVEYIQYSFANKLPECLASGAVILANGPAGVATIDYLKSNGCAAVVENDSEDSLIQKIEKVITDHSYRVALVEKARKVAFESHDLIKLREKVETLFIQVSQSRAITSHASFLTMDREVHAHLDETKIVAYLLATLPTGSVMIDVGAHHGTALAPFGAMGWKVFAFEPDPENRKCLVAKYGEAQNIVIDSRAVGECTKAGAAFYASDESTGISSLLAFRESHKPVGDVDVTTVADIIAEHNIEHVNFLKIDVEGYDFAVLKSVPWGGIEPDVIECEFEDAKTKYMGHSWNDICEYLVAKGYVVYVSEWHPIIRYGIRHDWRQFIRYPCELADPNAWGNLLAFKIDPGAAKIQKALHKVLTVKNPENIKPSAASQNGAISEGKQSVFNSLGFSGQRIGLLMSQRLLQNFFSYPHLVEWVQSKSPALFRIGQFAKWILRFLKRHPVASALGLAMLSMLVFMPILIPVFSSYGSYFWGAAVLLMISALSVLGVSFANKKMTEFVEREHCYRQSLRAEMLREMKKNEEQLVSRLKAQGQQLVQLTSRIETQGQQLAQLTSRIEAQGQQLARLASGVAEPDQQSVQLAQYMELVSNVPTRFPIFLPTDKVPMNERIRGLRRVSQIYNDQLDARYRPQIRALRERYKDMNRCFIIGNAPSLNNTDLSVLKDEVTFAVNGFFMKAPDLDWLPTFYVVEDHLVAEDRRKWINDFKGPTKLFPIYLGYCLDDGDDTIFFNHLPRVSYPHGFDFSTDAAEVTYAGCTVTYTCMQLAYYFGFQTIYLIGVDASYSIPKDVSKCDVDDVGVLDMQSDDPNHFHPDYFGKGFRWHDPQVDKMLEAYLEARRVLQKTEQCIINATIGGQLEVFERVKFSSIFPNALSPEEMGRLNFEKNSGRKNRF